MHKILGTIKSVSCDDSENNRGLWSSWIFIDFEDGGSQGFGGLYLKNKTIATHYMHSVCAAFGVPSWDDLVEKKCYALKNFGGYEESINGIESVDTGFRFTHYKWRKELFPEQTKDPFEERAESIKASIINMERDIIEKKKALANLKSKYKAW